MRSTNSIQIPKPATINSAVKPSPGTTKHPISKLQSLSSAQINSQKPSMAKPSSPKLSFASSKPSTLSGLQKAHTSSVNSLNRAGSMASKMSSSYTSSTFTHNPRITQNSFGSTSRLTFQQQRTSKPGVTSSTQSSTIKQSFKDKPNTPTNSSIPGFHTGSSFTGKGRSNTMHSSFQTPGSLKSKTYTSISLQKGNMTPPPTNSKVTPGTNPSLRPLPLPGLNSKTSNVSITPSKPILTTGRTIHSATVKAKLTPINTSMLSSSPGMSSAGLPISKSLSLSSKTTNSTTKSLLDLSSSPINRHANFSASRMHRDGSMDGAYRPDLPSLNGEPRRPLTPSQVLQNFKQFLSPYEWKEIYSYPEIWTFGIKYPRTHVREDSDICTFVDSSGNFCVFPGSHVAYRYEIIDNLGKGSFGTVMKCFDHKMGVEVAIKAIRSAAKFVQQAKVEIDILNNINSWDPENTHHAIRMLDTFTFRGHKMIVFELLNMNLYDFIKFNDFQGFNENIVRKVTYQVLKCLALLASHNVIHCDLKPENVMINPATTAIKVIDFGSSCIADQRVFTYIQSRFYRSPEIILEMPYGPAIDMWSLGCIVAELHSGYPIFPGSGENEQLERIMEYLGAPPLSMIMKSRRRVLFFDSSNNPRFSSYSHGKQRGPASSRNLANFLGTKDPDFLDFVSRCLDLDPATRMTPDEALQHPWIQVSRPGVRF
jgi:dual specificity tyrosine-phosphorylation-regulated kinase 2/3/4